MCECGLNDQIKDGRARGYCPLPIGQPLLERIKWMKQMWIGDNCHTYDRTVFKAQLDCGISRNGEILSNAIQADFKVRYFPFIQGDNYQCFSDFIIDS